MSRLINVVRSRVAQISIFIAAVIFAGSIAADTKPAKPLQLAQATPNFDVQAAYMRTCFACHNAGVSGAPRPNDADAWNERMEKGMEAVMQIVINGVNAMPAKGLCFDCTNEDLQAVVQYMYDTSQQ